MRLTTTAAQNSIAVSLSAVEDLGNFKIVTVRLGAQTLKVKTPEDQEIAAEHAYLKFPPQWTKVYANGQLIE